MGRFNKYSVVVGTERKAEKKDLLGADVFSTASVMIRLFWIASSPCPSVESGLPAHRRGSPAGASAPG